MSLARFQLPYVTTVQRMAVIPKDRDVLFDTDERTIYIGNGITYGGVALATIDISGKVDKITGYSLVANIEIAKIHTPGSDNQDLSDLQPKESGKGLSTNDYTDAEETKLAGIETGANNYTHPANHSPSIITQNSTNRFVSDTEKSTWNGKQDSLGFTPVANDDYRLADARPANDVYSWAKNAYKPSYTPSEVGAEPANINIQNHVTATHAPSNAVPLATVKADSEISDAIDKTHSNILDHSNSQDHSHTNKTQLDLVTDGDHDISAHAAIVNWQSVYRTILDSTGSHIAAKVAGTYGIPQGQPLAVSGTGTLYALNTIYIDSADYPTIDGKAAKLRVRCNIACNDVAPFTGTFVVGLHPVTRPGTSGGAGVCIYTIGSAVTGSTVTGTNLAADSQNNLVGSDFALPANGFYVLAVVTSATMATSSHCHVSASLQIRNA
jgi:hypothetical protein